MKPIPMVPCLQRRTEVRGFCISDVRGPRGLLLMQMVLRGPLGVFGSPAAAVELKFVSDPVKQLFAAFLPGF